MGEASYEIEIRFTVEQPAEAFALLPFLEASLGTPKHWSTDIIGREIYEAGKLLRVGRVPPAGETRYFLGYKGPDVGEFANIRQEWGEEITDGVAQSPILRELGLDGTYPTPDAVATLLAQAGHAPFMSFTGEDRLGYYAPLELHTKLCTCADILDKRVLIELEMSASSLEDAHAAESKLYELAEAYQLTSRLFREEPPTLLYQRTFD